MKRLYAVAAAAVIAVTGFAVAHTSSKSVASPIHVANVFADGVNHFDFRQACSVLAHRQGVRQCEVYFTVNVGSSAAFGGLDTYHVVAHSQKVWDQPYAGRTVRLAIVKLSYSKDAPLLTVHLRFRDGAWQIWWIGA